MLENLIRFSLKNKAIILLFTLSIVGFGIYSLTQISIGAVPDVTNNQIQVITTSKNLATQDVEQFITYPVELEMANLPGVKEIRSVSKFGLSVVTVVFDENMGTYLPRQLLAEKIKSASEKIPAGYGTPEMGPISTGLGEVYQYTLEVDESYKKTYSITDLRTIQDWIVKRQLSGLPGVVEINTWGGNLKQYEVAINLQKLKTFDIAIADVYTALEKNNSIAGGGYIEKTNEAYFVRGEGLLSTINDIENIVVSTKNNIPILIKDVSKVGIGSAPRFGAVTGNGEGEKVLGQIMMLKGGNSKKTIESIKDRVAEVSESLPKGVYINAFLERSELIGKTTFTISENLILGSLIVIFIVVLLLGNIRSGLVVASVIPLSLLFTISLMNIFDIDANLMSLGAIDFGIIIDGAVIIVEFIAFKITSSTQLLGKFTKAERQEAIDEVTFKSASKMMNSAIFGQLIILIVFIPILSLRGVEGKMFTPMALAFSFALVGAMILCFTYIPVVSALFLKPTKKSKFNISDKIMNFFLWMYNPVIKWALVNKNKVISGALIILASAVIIFTRMGGEFVPTLDEGDFVIQPVLKTGTSLSKTIEITTEIEQLLLDNFPEVDQVVSRIGAAEVPTDPMSMEESDVIIKLKPKGEWVSAKSKDELADKFKEVLTVIPNLEIEFTQPIEMRFNELITGVRADIAIKIFGDNLDILATKADEIKEAIKDIEGASDIIVEKIAGLPQMSVTYKRDKIARYGLNISDINELITMGFAGKTFGSIFEGEKQFDLVMRLGKNDRNDISDLQNLYIDTPVAGKIPLSELATISYTKGPAKISRDDTKRRVVVGVNVRNRDLQSVVDDIQNKIVSSVQLPTGYTISYGGQFENLNSAKARLLIAVPIALVLIFILLHFAFKSVKEALMVYSAIPLAAVGGVYLLWLRDLPFSISAGVGFIALFGIAVLNGIVLIEHFKELKAEGMDDVNERILRGTKERLRPVLLTAFAAALGFLPMAISTNAGAEVQRPLATVVIGGLVTSTILTLLVLPVLYAIFDTKSFKVKKKKVVTMMVLLMGSTSIFAQSPEPLTLNELLETAYANNLEMEISSLTIEQAEASINTAYQFDKTNVFYNKDETNLGFNEEALQVWGVEQSFLFPTVYQLDKKILSQQIDKVSLENQMLKNQLTKEVTQSYYELLYLSNKVSVYHYLDSLYQDFEKGTARKFELGESNYLEKITAAAKQQQVNLNLKAAKNQEQLALNSLQKWVGADIGTIKKETLRKLVLKVLSFENTTVFEQGIQQQELRRLETSRTKQSLLPDFNLSYFQGFSTDYAQKYNGFQVGVEIPLFFFGTKAKVQKAKIAQEIQEVSSKHSQREWNSIRSQLLLELELYQQVLEQYESQGKNWATEIKKMAQQSYQNGEIDFFDYIQSLENAKEIELQYLENLNAYNQTIIALNYLK